jgi:soluble lytic murein transglycosylase-like protein
MQLIPATAYRFGVRNSFDPRSNLDGGVRYLKYLLGLYDGNLQLSLAAYNAGEGAVSRRGGVPPYRETQNYVRRILELYPPRSVVLRPPPEPRVVKFLDSSGVVHFSNTDLP